MPRKKKEIAEDEPRQLQKRYEALDEAKKAAENGDGNAMVTALFQSYALDGLFRDLRRDFEELSHDDIHFIVAESVGVLKKYILAGKQFKNTLLGYLWRVARNKAFDLLRKRPPDSLITDRPTDELEEYLNGTIYDEAQKNKNRNEAFKLVRSMLHELGGENIRRVIEYSIEAIEKDVEITIDDICEALDLPSDVVRKSRSRGFQRLKRLFEARGLSIDAFEDEGF